MKLNNKLFLYNIFIGSIFLLIISCSYIADVFQTQTSEPLYQEPVRIGLRTNDDPGRTYNSTYQYVLSNLFTIEGGKKKLLNIEGTVLIDVLDPMGDDKGAGNLQYPKNYEEGTLDMHEVIVSADSNYVYIYTALLNRVYNSKSTADQSAGFLRVLLCAYFGKEGDTEGLTNFGTYSPADGSHAKLMAYLSPGFFTSNVAVKYTAAYIGSTTPYLGALTDNRFSATTSNQALISLISTNELIRTSYDVMNGVSTVFAVKIPRGNVLTSGKWKFIMITYGWEDYGLPTCYPGNNGYFRDIIGYAGSWAFGAGGSPKIPYTRKCADLLNNESINQSNILVSRFIDKNQMFDLNLP